MRASCRTLTDSLGYILPEAGTEGVAYQLQDKCSPLGGGEDFQ